MNRAESLTLVNSLGVSGAMTEASRVLTDTPDGYGPALDRAFRLYISYHELDTTVTTTDTADADDEGFEALLKATTYDLLLPSLAVLIDSSVDAPLTNVKFSQMYKAFKELRDAAWAEAANFGYGTSSNVGGFRVNLDHLEPYDTSGGEF